MNTSRRAFLGNGLAVLAVAQAPTGFGAATEETFLDILRQPDDVAAYVEGSGRLPLTKSGDRWQEGDVEVATEVKPIKEGRALSVSILAPRSRITRLRLRWLGRLPKDTRFLGDHWERSYGDLGWRGFDTERVMPWYFLAATGHATHGYGVMTGASALCFWQVDTEGISLWLDVRNGGSGLQLGSRRLAAADVVALPGHPDVSPYHSARALCRALWEHPRLPQKPVYGSNNWYYLWGEKMSAENVLRDVEQLADLSPLQINPPFMVLDAGWGGRADASPWTEDNLRFPEVPSLPAQMRRCGVRPGIWIRPLYSVDPQAKAWELTRGGKPAEPGSPFSIDPTIPEALAYIQEGLRRVTGWGYELVKHDFSTFDITGRWGFEMGAEVTSDGWHFADRSKTTAEIILQFYRALREAVGESMLLGCNTIGHLGAGVFEIQRIGDDNWCWNRTRKMGLNTLGFRLPQHKTFFLADPDCVVVSKTVPNEMNRQWLDLVALSGTALFISADPATTSREEKRMLKTALATAAQFQPDAEPLDWMETTSPERWRLGGKTANFTWFGKDGVDFLAKTP